MSAIVSAGHMATCLETWGIENEPQLEVIKRAVQDCQFYVVILGHCYGSIPSGKDKSYTELELDFAERHFGPEQPKRILSFILETDLVDKKRKKLSRQSEDGHRELENEKKYNEFRARLMGAGRWWRPFRTAGDIERDLFAFFRERHDEVPGYVRESEDTELIVRISTSNQVVKEVVQRAGRFTVVESRLLQSSGEKQALAQAFCDLHGEHIRAGNFDKVFVESGSTLTYLAARLAPFLPKVGQSHQSQNPAQREGLRKPIVATNNALAYLDLWLCNGVICRPEPDSPPTEDEKYGAMYGPLTGKKRDPDYALPNLKNDDPDSWLSIDALKDTFLTGVEDRKRSIVLAAASGLQLSPEITAIEPRYPPYQQNAPYTFEPILKLVRQCRGFHVGSYENKLLKRSLYLTGLPTIVFIHEEKIDCPIEVGKCHFLFDSGEPWAEVMESYPLSIWVGCSLTSSENVLGKLKTYLIGSWHFRIYGSGTYQVVIGHNDSFRNACKAADVAVFE